jgi:opacity protein-like surface antigen
MKTKLTIAVLLLGAASLASAAPAIDVSPGFLLGLNLAKVGGQTTVNGVRPGLSFGGFCNFALNNVLSFEPELYFTQKGAQTSVDIPGGMVTTSINLSYIEIPLLLKIAIPLGEDYIIHPRIFGGGTVAYSLSAKLMNRYEDYGGSSDQTGNFVNMKKWETGFIAGVGADFDVKGGVFSADIRYLWSQGSITSDLPAKKNHVITIMLGFAFK